RRSTESIMAEKTSGEMIRGNLDLLVLSALADGAKYGYLIQQSLNGATGGMVSVQAGTLYPLLHRLEAEKLVRSRWDDSTGRRRKWYELTTAGRKRLQHQADQWREYADCLWRVLRPVLGAS
ncbi:MAG TPA: PadR family transcriptional regulator, partial [Planctomycetaceae bacterium]|nr:PadR family transcriptional regulator [Planctomycetaceae bacterium]